MKSPFVFSKIVTGEKFVGREQEIKKLNNNFRDGISTFIISPRRTGKSSLVSQSIQVNKKEKLQRILELPQKIAEMKKRKIVICLDEFQDIEYQRLNFFPEEPKVTLAESA